jgi:hypothetical protein
MPRTVARALALELSALGLTLRDVAEVLHAHPRAVAVLN